MHLQAVIFKSADGKKTCETFSIGLSHSKCFLFDTFNIPFTIYLASIVLMHLNHFIQVFFIPVFANSLTKILTSMRGFYYCWAFKKWGTGGGEYFFMFSKSSSKAGKCIDFSGFSKKNEKSISTLILCSFKYCFSEKTKVHMENSVNFGWLLKKKINYAI